MVSQFKRATDKNLHTEAGDPAHFAWLRSLVQLSRPRIRQPRFVAHASALVVMLIIAVAVLTQPAIAQERKHPYSEYTLWFGGSFENGHAFSNTFNGRNYLREGRYERLIYWSEPFAVRWVFEVVPVALVGDPRISPGRRVYSYGIGGSPAGAQVNFVHYRHVEPFLTAGGGFLYFNHRMFGGTQFNFTAQ